MPSTMAVTYTVIRREVGRHLGYGRDTADWTDDQTQDVEDIIRTGMRLYLNPPIVPIFGARSHEWTWMRPYFSLSTVDGTRRYELANNVQNLIGGVYSSTDAQNFTEIIVTTPQRLMQMNAHDDSEGYPRYAALEPKTTDQAAEQIWYLVLHHTPDAVYTLTGQYQLDVRMISASYPYPPGGAEAGEGWLAACLAAAEEKIDVERGAKWAAFMERLQADIARDIQRGGRILGTMSHRHVCFQPRSRLRDHFDLTTGYSTYNSGTEL